METANAARKVPVAEGVLLVLVLAAVMHPSLAAGAGDAREDGCAARMTSAAQSTAETRVPEVIGSPKRQPGSQEGDDLALPTPLDNGAQVVGGSAELVFAFGDDRRQVVRHQPVRIPADMPLAEVAVTAPFGDVVDADGRALPSEDLAAAITRRGPGRLITVGICIDPSAVEEARPGEYTGTALVGVGDATTPIRLRVTFKDDRGVLVFLFALVGVTAGLFVKLFADNRSEGLPGTFKENFFSPRSIVAVGIGVVTAVYSYLTIYADDPTFVASFANLWRVTAEAFAGTLAAKALTDFARPRADPAGKEAVR